MIDRFSLENFKALQSAELALGRITVFIGPNGTGKSSALQALKLLKQSLGQAGLQTNGSLIDLGSFSDLVHKHRESEKIGFRISIHTSPDSRAPQPWDSGTRQYYEARFGVGGQLDSHEANIESGSQHVSVKWSPFAGTSVSPGSLALDNGRALGISAANSVGQAMGFSTTGPFSELQLAALSSIFSALQTSLREVYVVPAVRGIESTSYPLESGPIIDMFDARPVEQHASRVLSTIAYRRELEEQISEYSQRILNIRLRVKLVRNQRVTAEAYNGASTNLVNEGFGANQLMILLAQLVIAPPSSVLGLEEAEIHLHPLAQSDFATILVELASRDTKQIVLTTHSEHIMMGLLTHVASGRLRPEDLSVYYFSKDETGTAHAERLEVDGHGRLIGGLKGFFEANVAELDQFLSALSKQVG